VIDWNDFKRKIDEYDRLQARVQALEVAFRHRAERARDERDIATMVRLRDAMHEANARKAHLASLADGLAKALALAQAEQTQASFDTLMTRLDETGVASHELAALYEPLVEWRTEPS
jgi:hypothetical protein